MCHVSTKNASVMRFNHFVSFKWFIFLSMYQTHALASHNPITIVRTFVVYMMYFGYIAFQSAVATL